MVAEEFRRAPMMHQKIPTLDQNEIRLEEKRF
jgi:hypothetical protein